MDIKVKCDDCKKEADIAFCGDCYLDKIDAAIKQGYKDFEAHQKYEKQTCSVPGQSPLGNEDQNNF